LPIDGLHNYSSDQFDIVAKGTVDPYSGILGWSRRPAGNSVRRGFADWWQASLVPHRLARAHGRCNRLVEWIGKGLRVHCWPPSALDSQITPDENSNDGLHLVERCPERVEVLEPVMLHLRT
jgi:hypothetical protein